MYQLARWVVRGTIAAQPTSGSTQGISIVKVMRRSKSIMLVLLGMPFWGHAQQYFQQLNGSPRNWDHYHGVKYLSATRQYIGMGSSLDLLAEDDSAYYQRLRIDQLDSNGKLLKQKFYPYPDRMVYFQRLLTLNNQVAVLYDQQSKHNVFDNQTYLTYVNAEADTTQSILLNAFPLGGYSHAAFTINKLQQLVFATQFGKYVGDSFYLCATDTLGSLLWLKEHRGINKSVAGMTQTQDGGYLLVGYQPENVLYIPWEWYYRYTGHPQRLWMAKFDSIGNELWQKAFSGEYYEPIDSNYYEMYGPSTIGASFRGILPLSNGTYLAYGKLNFFPYMVNINEQGTILWEYKYDSARITQGLFEYPKGESFYQVIEKDGFVYALGYKDDKINHFFWKLNLNGDVSWKRIFPTYQPNNFSQLGNIEPLQDGFLLMGTARDSNNWEAQQDAWLIKIDTNGCLYKDCGLVSIGEQREAMKHEIVVYPNPASGQIVLQNVPLKSTITILNTTGNNQLQTAYNGNPIDISKLKPGLYFISIVWGKNTYVKKLNVY